MNGWLSAEASASSVTKEQALADFKWSRGGGGEVLLNVLRCQLTY